MKSAFLQFIQEQMYQRRYAKSTIRSYLRWVAAFIRFNKMTHSNIEVDYNQTKSHSVIGFMSPIQFEQQNVA